MMRAPEKRGAPATEGTDREVRRLGEALGARVEDVLARTVARGRSKASGSSATLEPAVVESFARIGRRSTLAVAQWMGGGDPAAGRDAGGGAWHTSGQLAGQNAGRRNGG